MPKRTPAHPRMFDPPNVNRGGPLRYMSASRRCGATGLAESVHQLASSSVMWTHLPLCVVGIRVKRRVVPAVIERFRVQCGGHGLITAVGTVRTGSIGSVCALLCGEYGGQYPSDGFSSLARGCVRKGLSRHSLAACYRVDDCRIRHELTPLSGWSQVLTSEVGRVDGKSPSHLLVQPCYGSPHGGSMCNTCDDLLLNKEMRLDARWVLRWYECGCSISQLTMFEKVKV